MSDSKKKVTVVIPVYKQTLTPDERTSLKSIVTTLGNHPIVIVKPEGLDLTSIRDEFGGWREECFDPDFFRGIKGYNRLMMSEEFYGRFSDSEYILIAQLDTLIFSDSLGEWCDKGYDYVGAPWIVRSLYDHWFMKFCSAIKRSYCNIFNHPNGQMTNNKVGNGGLSLRKVQSHLEAVKKLQSVVKDWTENPHKPRHLFNEDVFFSVEVNRRGLSFRYPDYMEALGFSFDKHPCYCYNLTGQKLPMGCHGWSKKRMRKFWTPIIDNLRLH